MICSDNATCFTAFLFSKFLKDNGIKHITSAPYCPSSNGQAERGVRVVKELLKKQGTSGSFKSRLAKALFYYRCVPHNVTQVAPAVALNSRKLISAKDRINPNYTNDVNNKDHIKKIGQFEIGDTVLALNFREGSKWYEATVVHKLGINVYDVLVSKLNVIWKRHKSQLLSVPSGTLPSIEQTADTNVSLPDRVISSRIRKPPVRFGYD